jgi:hypothetical protein
MSSSTGPCWFSRRKGPELAHAFHDGRRFSVCAGEQRIAESLWRPRKLAQDATCITCARYVRHGAKPRSLLEAFFVGDIY